MTIPDDPRLVAAREALDHGPPSCVAVLRGLVAYADERLRVNVGLVAENSELRRRARTSSPDGIDLTGVSSQQLLTELGRRVTT